eukprot:scaffold27731_cov102-Skeletonema_marinoi.AAC.2
MCLDWVLLFRRFQDGHHHNIDIRPRHEFYIPNRIRGGGHCLVLERWILFGGFIRHSSVHHHHFFIRPVVAWHVLHLPCTDEVQPGLPALSTHLLQCMIFL